MKRFLLSMAVVFSGALSADTESDFWLAYATDTPPPLIDHSSFDTLLKRHLSERAHAEWGHRFNPDGVSRKEKKALKSYISSLEDIDPRYYDYDQQLAYWLNLYNAITVSALVDADDFGDIKNLRTKKVATVAGKKITQEYIAQNILMPIWQDSSIYFLLSCGALDCPPVPYEAYRPETARQQAKGAMEAYLNGPSGYRLADGTLHLPRAFAYFASYYSSNEAMIKRLAFVVPGNEALTLLGHSGAVEYSQHNALAKP